MAPNTVIATRASILAWKHPPGRAYTGDNARQIDFLHAIDAIYTGAVYVDPTKTVFP